MKKVLITGFNPFGGEKINPAYEAIKLLPDNLGEKIEIVKLEVPTVFHKSIEFVISKMLEEKPDVTILVGQAGGRFAITPERVAINIDDARIKDNENNQPLNVKIFEDGENAYFSTLPVKRIVGAIQEFGLPASLSNSAGTFVCNHLMYGVLYHISKNDKLKNIKSGFIHVPFTPNQVVDKPGVASMNLQDIAAGLEIAINVAVTVAGDKNDLVLGETE